MEQTDGNPASSIFTSFLAPGIDRCAFIASWLRARKIPHTVVDLAGKKHIVVRFASESYDGRFRIKTLVAHYDRADGTPGANDNSAACFQLMLLAERLASFAPTRTSSRAEACEKHNVRIFFTDGEEAAGTKGIAGQGSFALGSGLRKLKMTGDDVYVFDACGRGDTLILSTAGMNKTGAMGERLIKLHERSAEIARAAASENWMRLHTPYSDNAGFLASGIASQVFTVLPHAEAATLELALKRECAPNESENDPQAKKMLESALTKNQHTIGSVESLDPAIPHTWKLMHTANDSADTLTAQAFILMRKLLDEITKRKDIAR